MAVLASCGDDESASDRACDARAELRSAVEAVVDDLAAGNLGDARDSVGDATDALGDLSEALSELADEQAEELQPDAEALRDDVEALADVSTLEELSNQLDEVRAGITALVASVADTLNCE